jgi:hypothetical protein
VLQDGQVGIMTLLLANPIAARHGTGVQICCITHAWLHLWNQHSLAATSGAAGSRALIRRSDGILVSVATSPYPLMIYDMIKRGQWEKATRLCRFIKVCLSAEANTSSQAFLWRQWRVKSMHRPVLGDGDGGAVPLLGRDNPS